MDLKRIERLARVIIDSHRQNAEAIARLYSSTAEEYRDEYWADIWDEVAERIAVAQIN
jgi:hypothetical protein